jgi:hypothetical protein
VRIEDRRQHARGEAWYPAPARAALPQTEGTARFGPILAEPADAASAK